MTPMLKEIIILLSPDCRHCFILTNGPRPMVRSIIIIMQTVLIINCREKITLKHLTQPHQVYLLLRNYLSLASLSLIRYVRTCSRFPLTVKLSYSSNILTRKCHSISITRLILSSDVLVYLTLLIILLGFPLFPIMK